MIISKNIYAWHNIINAHFLSVISGLYCQLQVWTILGLVFGVPLLSLTGTFWGGGGGGGWYTGLDDGFPTGWIPPKI